MAADFERLIVPAFGAVRDHASVLMVLTKAHNQLVTGAPLSSIDEALKTIDEFLQKREADNRQLSRDLEQTVRRVRQQIDSARMGPPPTDLKPLHDEIHHQTIHPMQAQALQNARQIQQLADVYQRLSDQLVRGVLPESIGAAAAAAGDPK